MKNRRGASGAVWRLRSPYTLPSGRTVAWTAEKALDHVRLMPFHTGKTTIFIPRADYDWKCELTVHDEYGREIFHREVCLE